MLSRRTALSGPILDEALNFLRKEGRVEVRAGASEAGTLRFALTERGRGSAQVAFARSGIRGSRARSSRVLYECGESAIRTQPPRYPTTHACGICRCRAGSRSPGSSRACAELRQSHLHIWARRHRKNVCHAAPHAAHGRQRVGTACDLDWRDGHTAIRPLGACTARSAIPRRDAGGGLRSTVRAVPSPLVITGGELSPDMLEVQFDSGTRQHRAPLQLKATNGLFILDDLGRQRVPPQTVLNRWIVPMEESRDYLSLATGQHFSVPVRRGPRVLDEPDPGRSRRRRIPSTHRLQDPVRAAAAPSSITPSGNRFANSKACGTTPRSARTSSTRCTYRNARRCCLAIHGISSRWRSITQPMWVWGMSCAASRSTGRGATIS